MKINSIKNIIWNGVDYTSSLILFLISTKLIISNLGPVGYGVYSLVISFGVTIGLLDLGMGAASSKYIIENLHKNNHKRVNQILTTILSYYTIVIGIIGLIYILTSKEINDAIGITHFSNEIVEFSVISIFILTLFNFYSSMLISIIQAFSNWKLIALINISTKIVLLCIYLIIWKYFVVNNFTFFIIALLIVGILRCLILFYFSNKILIIKMIKPSKNFIKQLKFYVKNSIQQFGLSSVIGHFDKFFIAKFYGVEATGYYSFCGNVFAFLYGFIGNISKVFTIRFMAMASKKIMYIDLNYFFKSSGVISIIAFALSLAVIILWKPLMGYLYGHDFADNTFMVMMFFIIYYMIRFSEPMFSDMYFGIGRPDIVTKSLYIAAPLTIMGYFLFVPFFHVYGFILAMALGAVGVFLYNSIQFKKFINR